MNFETPTQVFSCEYYEIFKNTYFEDHVRAATFRQFNKFIRKICKTIL